MQVPCPNCEHALDASALRQDRAVTECPHCHQRQDSRVLTRRFRLLESGVAVRPTNRGIQITVPWFHAAYAVMGVLFLAANVWAIFAHGLFQEWNAGIAALLVGDLLIGYFIAVHMVNRTCVTIGNGELVVARGPLPLLAKRRMEFNLSEIKTLTVSSIGGAKEDAVSLKRTARSYFLNLVTKNERSTSILPSRADRDIPELVREEIHACLDKPV